MFHSIEPRDAKLFTLDRILNSGQFVDRHESVVANSHKPPEIRTASARLSKSVSESFLIAIFHLKVTADMIFIVLPLYYQSKNEITLNRQTLLYQLSQPCADKGREIVVVGARGAGV